MKLKKKQEFTIRSNIHHLVFENRISHHAFFCYSKYCVVNYSVWYAVSEVAASGGTDVLVAEINANLEDVYTSPVMKEFDMDVEATKEQNEEEVNDIEKERMCSLF